MGDVLRGFAPSLEGPCPWGHRNPAAVGKAVPTAKQRGWSRFPATCLSHRKFTSVEWQSWVSAPAICIRHGANYCVWLSQLHAGLMRKVETPHSLFKGGEIAQTIGRTWLSSYPSPFHKSSFRGGGKTQVQAACPLRPWPSCPHLCHQPHRENRKQAV